MRFAEVLQTSPLELQQATVFTFTRERDYDNTRRVLALVSQPGPLADEGVPLEVVLTNPQGQRFLVRVSALMDDAERPCYLLFTPKALLPDPDDADEGEPEEEGAPTPTGHGHGHGNGHGNGHHVVKDEAPGDAPPSAASAKATAMGSAASSATSSPALGLARGTLAAAGVTSSEGSSIGSANSSSNSLYHSSPRGGAALAGTTEAAMAAARTLPAHVKPMI